MTKIALGLSACVALVLPLSAQQVQAPPPVSVSPGFNLTVCPPPPNSLALCSLFTSTTAVSNSGTAETDLITYPMPGGVLSVNNQKVRITAYFTTAVNANNKTLKMYFGSTVLYTTGALAFSGRTHKIVGEVIRTGATAQAGSAVYMDTNGAGGEGAWVTPAETLSGAVTIKVTGTSGTASNDITAVAMFVELVP